MFLDSSLGLRNYFQLNELALRFGDKLVQFNFLLVLEQFKFCVGNNYLFLIQMLPIFVIIFSQLSVFSKLKSLFFLLKSFAVTSLYVIYFTQLRDLSLKKKACCENHKNTLVSWCIWGTGCLFIFSQT